MKIPKKFWVLTPAILIPTGLMLFFLSYIWAAAPAWTTFWGAVAGFLGGAWLFVDWMVGILKI